MEREENVFTKETFEFSSFAPSSDKSDRFKPKDDNSSRSVICSARQEMHSLCTVLHDAYPCSQIYK